MNVRHIIENVSIYSEEISKRISGDVQAKIMVTVRDGISAQPIIDKIRDDNNWWHNK